MRTRATVLGLVALTLGGAQAANAGVALNTIDSHVTYERDGALVRTTGPIGCTRGERIAVRVRVSQRATGARARGAWKARCTGDVQHWQVRARVRAEARFASGAATVCAVARSRAGRDVTETRKWCRRVTVAATF